MSGNARTVSQSARLDKSVELHCLHTSVGADLAWAWKEHCLLIAGNHSSRDFFNLGIRDMVNLEFDLI